MTSRRPQATATRSARQRHRLTTFYVSERPALLVGAPGESSGILGGEERVDSARVFAIVCLRQDSTDDENWRKFANHERRACHCQP